VTLSSATSVYINGTLDGANVSGTSAITCRRPSQVHVEGLQVRELLRGRCRVETLGLQLPMQSLTSAPITIAPTPGGDSGWRVVLAAGASVIGEGHTYSAAESASCRLNALGRELLERARRLRVLVREYHVWTEYPQLSGGLWLGFSTVLTLAGDR